MKLRSIVALVVLWLVPRPAAAKGCHEVSQVIGHHRCTWFGTWSRDGNSPPLIVDFGYLRHRFDSEPFSLGAAPMLGAPRALGTVATTAQLRVLYGFSGLFYTGLELAPGTITTLPVQPGPAIKASPYIALHLVGGVHVAVWRLALATELAAGFRYDSFDTCARNCPNDAPSVDQDRRELEVRVRADFFIHPRFSLGVALGRSVIDRDDTVFMINAGIHLRALDGMY